MLASGFAVLDDPLHDALGADPAGGGAHLGHVAAVHLGPVEGHYTDWTPLDGRPGLFPEDLDTKDPWQFKNVLVR